MKAAMIARIRHRSGGVPLRWRLTFASVLVLTIILAIYSTSLYKQVEGAIVTTTANGLRTSARPAIVQQLRSNTFRQVATPTTPGGIASPVPPAVAAALPGTPAETALADLARSLTSRTIAARTIDITGATIGDGPAMLNMTDATMSAPLLDPAIYREVAATKEERYWRLETPSGPVVVELIPLVLAGSDQPAVGVLQLSTSLRNGDALLETLRNQLLIGALIALIATVALTLPLIRGVLGPLRRIAAASRAIAGGDLTRRVDVPASGDAVADLAVSFNEMVGKLDAALATQRRFIADASHELRTPLTALGNGVEMLQMGVDQRDPASREKVLRLMSGEIARMRRLVDDLLTLSALDRESAQTLRLTRLDLVALTAQLVDETRLLAPDRTIEHNAVGTGAIMVQADSDRLRQALLNLTANARAHTAPGGRIVLDVRREREEARITVADTGSGIPPEALSRVWERFFRADPSRERKREAGGVGLGLAIVRAIVEAHGGKVTLESVVGSGTMVTIVLPLEPATAAQPLSAAPRRTLPEPATVPAER
jgi:two-component system OmpR family sensor kinase